MKSIFFISVLLFANPVFSQLEETFSSPDISSIWSKDTTSWEVKNGMLRSKNQKANSTFFISTPLSINKGIKWHLQLDLLFNTSSLNYVDIYLTIDNQNLLLAQNGYFVRLGGSKDEISLYKKKDGKIYNIIDGQDNILNKSSSSIELTITLDKNAKWSLSYQETDHPWVIESPFLDSSVTTYTWFGIAVAQSTPSFFGKHLINKISIKPIHADVNLISKTRLDAHRLALLFTPILDSSLSKSSLFKLIKEGIPEPISCTFLNTIGDGLVELIFDQEILMDTEYNLVMNLDNLTSLKFPIFFSSPTIANRNNIIITEIFPDPVPSSGLPEKEFIEIFNITAQHFDLKDYTVTDYSTTAHLPSYILKPGSHLILCQKTDVEAFMNYGEVLGIDNFPSLNNINDRIAIRNSKGEIVNEVTYSNSYYGDSQKDDGGYTLELKDYENYCLKMSNWSVSKDITGGTPGKQSSLFTTIVDTVSPNIKQIIIKDSNTVEILFDEPVDSSSFSKANISFRDIQIENILWNKDSLDKVRIKFQSILQENQLVLLLINELKDCSGNKGFNESFEFIIPYRGTRTNLISLNEVLVNPYSYGADFVEFYNNSPYYKDLINWSLATERADTITNRKLLFSKTTIIKPYGYLVVTTNKNIILNHYPKSIAHAILEVTSLPTFDDEEGVIVVLNAKGEIEDKLDYSNFMHSPFITNPEGVSIEKINPALYSNDPNNWASASKEVGYATPGYKNSQSIELGITEDAIEITPLLITPNGDGDRDLMAISIKNEKIGHLRSMNIFDIYGRNVKRLENASYVSSQSMIQWDGTDNNQQIVPIGHYILWIQIVDKEGLTKEFKKKVAVGERF